MVEVKKRWLVTYTKHIKQKRKVYQDGNLHLLSNNKVMLYDESEQLLDSRFLTKDEIVESGESLPFTSFLVDIGDPANNPSISLHPNPTSENGNRTKETTGWSHEEMFTPNSKGRRKLNLAQKKTSTANLSPSQKIIREFKKNEAFKYEVKQTLSPPSATTSSFTEWEALYTTQITQKAKKYHDGYIRVIACGSQGRQVMLYDSSKNQLDKRFLKKDEVISCGESLTFDAYLVDIGDSMESKEDDTNVKTYRRNCEMTEEMDTVSAQRSHQKFPGKPQHSACSSVRVNSNMCSLGVKKMKLGRRHPSHMPLRAAHQILSILKKPTALDTQHQHFQGSLPVDLLHPSEMALEKSRDEETANGGCTKTFSEDNNAQSESGHDDLSSSPPVSCNNNKESHSIKGQPPFGSALIDRLQATSSHGNSFILDYAQGHAASNKFPDTDCKCEEVASLISDMLKPNCPNDDCMNIGSNVKIEKPIETFECPSFDLGIGI